MPKQVIIPPGTTAPIAPFVPGTLADGVVYVSGTLPFDKQNNVVHIGDPRRKPATCWRPSGALSKRRAGVWRM